MPTFKFEGQLEIDQRRGVIYFHDENGVTLLRICRLPIPVPSPKIEKPNLATVTLGDMQDFEYTMLDITHMRGASWRGSIRTVDPHPMLGPASSYFVISKNDADPPMYWSVKNGWAADRNLATRFDYEATQLGLPDVPDGYWIEVYGH